MSKATRILTLTPTQNKACLYLEGAFTIRARLAQQNETSKITMEGPADRVKALEVESRSAVLISDKESDGNNERMVNWGASSERAITRGTAPNIHISGGVHASGPGSIAIGVIGNLSATDAVGQRHLNLNDAVRHAKSIVRHELTTKEIHLMGTTDTAASLIITLVVDTDAKTILTCGSH